MDTIILIGMPNVGKSSVGSILAHDMNKKFIDTDEIITKTTSLTPRQIVLNKGELDFLRIQQDIILNMNIKNAVIATGGSVIYSEKLMYYLKERGYIIYLKAQLNELSNRMTKERRIVGSSVDNFNKLYKERNILYKKYADTEIDCSGKSIQEVVSKIKVEVLENE